MGVLLAGKPLVVHKTPRLTCFVAQLGTRSVSGSSYSLSPVLLWGRILGNVPDTKLSPANLSPTPNLTDLACPYHQPYVYLFSKVTRASLKYFDTHMFTICSKQFLFTDHICLVGFF